MIETTPPKSANSKLVKDEIFPIVTGIKNNGELTGTIVLGTAFFIGREGYSLTAAHVIKDIPLIYAALIQNDKWNLHRLEVIAIHPTEDIALLKTNPPKLPGQITIDPKATPHASLPYISFGYPDDTYFEFDENRAPNGRVLPNPDLVCTIGYVRRRIKKNIPTLIGSSFIELSEVAGLGCSGSPILAKELKLIGIYVGEKINEIAPVGYAVRIDSFASWEPKPGWFIYDIN